MGWSGRGRLLHVAIALCLVSVITLIFVRARLRGLGGLTVEGDRQQSKSNDALIITRKPPISGRSLVFADSVNWSARSTDPPFFLFPDLPNKRTQSEGQQFQYRLVTIAERMNKTVGTTSEQQQWSLLRLRAPRLVYLHSAIDHVDAAELVEYASHYYARSAVGDHGNGNSKIDPARSSFGVFLQSGRGGDLPANVRLRRRVASVVGLPEECSESTQILRYTLGQEYRSHPDTFSADMTVTLARGGQRILTVIVWLTDVIAGGTTTFPNSVDPKVTVSPRKGDGLVFYNVMENFKDIDLTHIHSGDPLVNGTKVVAVMWFHPRRFV